MTKKLLFLLTIVTCFSCFDTTTNNQDVWVYVEVLSEDNDGPYDVNMYGQIKNSIFERIQNDSDTKGIFLIKNIRYINEDDFLQTFEDDQFQGSSVYRIEKIITMDVLKSDPIFTFNKDKLHESCKKILAAKASNTGVN